MATVNAISPLTTVKTVKRVRNYKQLNNNQINGHR